MGTSYAATVRTRVLDVAPDDEFDLVQRLTESLPEGAGVHTDRRPDRLVIEMVVGVNAQDASQVQLQARELCRRALDSAGMNEGRAPLVDISVATST